MFEKVLLGAAVLGVGFLVFREVKKSRKKCGCEDNAAASIAPTDGSTVKPAVSQPQTAMTSTALAADGFKEKFI